MNDLILIILHIVAYTLKKNVSVAGSNILIEFGNTGIRGTLPLELL